MLAQLRSDRASPLQHKMAAFLAERARTTGSRLLSELAVAADANPFGKVNSMPFSVSCSHPMGSRIGRVGVAGEGKYTPNQAKYIAKRVRILPLYSYHSSPVVDRNSLSKSRPDSIREVQVTSKESTGVNVVAV